jgi:RecG-like helicase
MSEVTPPKEPSADLAIDASTSQAPSVEQPVEAKEARLVDIDRNLAPIRRLLAWLANDTRSRLYKPSHVEGAIRPWLERLQALNLAQAIREGVARIDQSVANIDEHPIESMTLHINTAYQELTRLDAILGLPLRSRGPYPPARRRKVKRKAPAPDVRDEVLVAEEAPRETAKPRSERRDERDELPAEDGARREAATESQPREKTPDRWGGNLVQSLTEVGFTQELVDIFAEMSVATVAELLAIQPSGYEDHGAVLGAGTTQEEGDLCLSGRVARTWVVLDAKGEAQQHVGFTGQEECLVTLRVGERMPRVGDRMIFRGIQSFEDGVLRLTDGHRVRAASDKHVYSTTYGLDSVSDIQMRDAISKLYGGFAKVRDPLTDEMRGEMMKLGDALLRIQREPCGRAKERLAFDEALGFFLSHGYQRQNVRGPRGTAHPIVNSLVSRLSADALYQLNDEQQVALEGVRRDLARQEAMARVLVGQEGSGLSLVVLHTIVMVAETRSQVAVVCSSSSSAEEQYALWERMLKDMGLVARFIDGEPSAAMRDALERGEVHVVFGTPALLAADVDYRRLGLVISDIQLEGPRVLDGLRKRSGTPVDLLLIARHEGVACSRHALCMRYADHDMAALPPGAAGIAGVLIDDGQRAEAYAGLVNALGRGRQGMVVFPRIQGDDVLDLEGARNLVRVLGDGELKGYKVGLYHGRDSRDERQRTHQRFLNRALDVLVVTGEYEDAIVTPGLGAVVVEQAQLCSPMRLTAIMGHLRSAPVAGELWCVVAGDEDDAQRVVLQSLLDASFQRSEEGSHAQDDEASPNWAWLDAALHKSAVVDAHKMAAKLLHMDHTLKRAPAQDIARAARNTWAQLFPNEDEYPCPLPRWSQDRKRRRRRRRR